MYKALRFAQLPAFALTLACSLGAQERGGRGFGPPNLLFTTLDADRDGTVSAAEITNAAAALRTLDTNKDGKLTPDETRAAMPFGRGEGGGRGQFGGRGPEGQGPGGSDTTEETVKTYMAFDENGDGKLQKSEVPERMQGIFERGDTNKDGVLTVEELRAMARAQSQQSVARGRGGEGEREGGRDGGRGRGGFGMMDPIFNALDTDHDNEIDAAELERAPASLKSLDKNQDGNLTQEEVRPNFGFGPGRGMQGGH
jgi:Ca2+-binding EF-hand superfamily protein